MMVVKHILFDWGDTLMVDYPDANGPMNKWFKVAAVDGALEALTELSAKGVSCHVATNAKDSNEEQIRSALKRVNLDQYIQDIFCFQRIGHTKPSKAFFDGIALSLNCLNSDLLMVGDNFENDVKGALACGLQSIWFNPSNESVPEGVIAITSLVELRSIKMKNI